MIKGFRFTRPAQLFCARNGVSRFGDDRDEHVRTGRNLDVEGIGTVKGKSALAVVAGRAPSSRSLPPNFVDHTQGVCGTTDKIYYGDQCNSRQFVTNEPGKETKAYI